MKANPDTDTETEATVSATSPMPFPATKKSLAVRVRRAAQTLMPTMIEKYAIPTAITAGCATFGNAVWISAFTRLFTRGQLAIGGVRSSQLANALHVFGTECLGFECQRVRNRQHHDRQQADSVNHYRCAEWQ